MSSVDMNRRNRILSALPHQEQQRFYPQLELVALTPAQVLYGNGEPLSHVYFPVTSVISLMNVMQDGQTIEVATVGNEGMVGLRLFFGINTASAKAITQSPGLALRAQADIFNEEARKEPFRMLVDRFIRALLGQIFLSGGCNHFHSVTERCARWLLMMQDRAGVDEFPFTQEFLADILGVRRQSIAVVEATMERAGLIKAGRGKVTITDREGLETISCECYKRVRDEYDLSFGPNLCQARAEL